MNRTFFTSLALSTLIVLGGIVTRAGEGGADLRVKLATRPEHIGRGTVVTLTLDVRDRTNKKVVDLPLVHERPIHLIIVPADLSLMAHLHPEKVGRGLYRTTYTFPGGGRYRVYADLKSPEGHPMVVPFTLEVQGDVVSAVPLEGALARGNRTDAGGLRAERISPPRLTPGVPVELGFALTDIESGGPVSDLEPYLGTMAHVIIISRDGADFLHAHTMGGGTHPDRGTHGGHVMQKEHVHGAEAGATTLNVHTTFPRAGLYRLWMQVNRKGHVVTLPFTVSVSE